MPMRPATAPNLRALNGVRAVASLFIVIYHCFRLLASLITDEQTVLLLRQSALFRCIGQRELCRMKAIRDLRFAESCSVIAMALPVCRLLSRSPQHTPPLTHLLAAPYHPLCRLALLGNAGVDVFLALSSTLAVYHLLPELEGGSGSSCSTRPAGCSSCSNSTGATSGPALRSDNRHNNCSKGALPVTRVVLRYYARRARRIVPAYAAANLLILLLEAGARHAQQNGRGLSPLASAAKNFCFAQCPQGLWANALFVTHLLGRQGCGECGMVDVCVPCPASH